MKKLLFGLILVSSVPSAGLFAQDDGDRRDRRNRDGDRGSENRGDRDSRDRGPEGRDRGPEGRDRGPEGRDRGPEGRDRGPEGRDRGPEGRDRGPEGRDKVPEGRGPQGPGRTGGPGGFNGPGFGGPAGGGPGGPMMQFFPVIVALDTDRNGTISESEIQNASKSLLKLDKNGDGQITADELRPDPAQMARMPEGGFRPGPGQDVQRRPEGERRPDDRRPEDRRPDSDRPEGGRPGSDSRDGDSGRRPEGFAAMGPEMIAKMFERQDANEDGVLSGNEIPERMKDRMKMVDTNNDGMIQRSELEKAAAMMKDRGPERGGDRPGRGNDADGGGVRPKRPGA